MWPVGHPLALQPLSQASGYRSSSKEAHAKLQTEDACELKSMFPFPNRLASHDAFNNCCIPFPAMSPSVFLLSQQVFIPALSSPLLVSRIRTKRVSVSVGGVCKRNMTMAAWPGLFPSPGNAALYFMELTLAVGGPMLAFREVNGENNRYSKFASEGTKNEAMIASKTGMFLFYFPAALLASVFLAWRLEILPLAAFSESFGGSSAASFFENALVADADDRLVLVAAAMFVHFSKRVLEVLFVHKYSGSVCVNDTAIIASTYACQLCFLLYSQLLSAGSEAPFPNLKWLGVALFLIGVTGNAYHHWILSHLRKDGNNKYVVPQGGLFDLLVCPHYVFEMIDIVGIALISQTLFGWCMVWSVSWYLTGRAISTKKWYMKKVEGFPEERSVLIPGVF